ILYILEIVALAPARRSAGEKDERAVAPLIGAINDTVECRAPVIGHAVPQLRGRRPLNDAAGAGDARLLLQRAVEQLCRIELHPVSAHRAEGIQRGGLEGQALFAYDRE